MQLWGWLCLLLLWCLDNVTSSLTFASIMSVFISSFLVYPAYASPLAFALRTFLWNWNILTWVSAFSCSINVASASSSAILAFPSSSLNFFDNLQLPLDLLLVDNLEVFHLLLLRLHLELLDDFCAASFNQLCTLCLKLNTSWWRLSDQSSSCCWFSASNNLQYSSWWLVTNLNKSEYWSSSPLTATWLPGE